MKPFILLAVLILWGSLVPVALRADTSDQDLQTAFAKLVEGREYLRTFPELKSRAQLIRDYLDATTNGVFVTSPKYDSLAAAMALAVSIRNRADASAVQLDYARIIAWQSLSAALNGQLFAGNSDFLNALRVAFPSPVQDDKPPGTDRGCETKFFHYAASGRASLRAACWLSRYFQKSSSLRLL